MEDMGKAAARLIIKKIKSDPACTLGLATGSTPLPLYAELVSAYQRGEVSFKKVSTYNLDEYVGLAPENENSYRHFMNANLFDHVDIDIRNTHVPSGLTAPERAVFEYRRLLDAAQINIQVLGIGTNGHIGFNEPGVAFDSNVHVVDLDEQTIQDNARYFDAPGDVPRQAVTMGIADIMAAEEIILMAGTENKRDAIRKVLEGPVSNTCPATILREHKGLTIIALKNVLHDIHLNLI